MSCTVGNLISVDLAMEIDRCRVENLISAREREKELEDTV